MNKSALETRIDAAWEEIAMILRTSSPSSLGPPALLRYEVQELRFTVDTAKSSQEPDVLACCLEKVERLAQQLKCLARETKGIREESM